MNSRRYEPVSGFTLVELAIALMVIGLLIGGVLKGQELIENARVTRTIKDLKDYDTAIMIFRNTYNALPGDMKNAATRLPDCGAPYCNLTSSVTGNGLIENGTETRNFWIHLDRADMISGINEQADSYRASPLNAFGGYSTIKYLTAMGADPATAEHPNLHYYRVGDPNNNTVGDTIGSCTRIRAIDDKMDDGKPLSGTVRTFVDLHDSTTCHDTDSGGYTNARTRTHLLVESSTAN